jgi:hypothetical protein
VVDDERAQDTSPRRDWIMELEGSDERADGARRFGVEQRGGFGIRNVSVQIVV